MNVIRSLAIAAALVAPVLAQAQSDYPKQQIRILVGFPAGGSTDVLARVLAQEARKALGQDLIVINKGGAAGALAINEVIASPPDGYTIAITPSSVLTIAHHFQNIRPDMLEKTDALVMAARQRTGLMTRADGGPKDFRDFVAQAKANPGKLSVGIIGPGTMGCLLYTSPSPRDS